MPQWARHSTLGTPRTMKPIAGKVVELETKDDFDAFLKEAASTLVVVDFYADCRPWALMFSTVMDFAEKFSGKVYFAKVHLDKSKTVAQEEGISALPTYMLYKNSLKVDELTGANEAKLRELIEANI